MPQQRQEVETQQEQLAHHIVAVVALAILHVLATVATHEQVGEVVPGEHARAANSGDHCEASGDAGSAKGVAGAASSLGESLLTLVVCLSRLRCALLLVRLCQPPRQPRQCCLCAASLPGSQEVLWNWLRRWLLPVMS